MSSHQTEGTKIVCPGGTFQDGRVALTSRSNPAGGLDDQIGSDRCLPPGANLRSSPS